MNQPQAGMTQLVSYAQNFEDVMLWRALGHVSDGCYVDVGAQSPDTDSVSRLFHERGWRGVHVEPTPAYADQLRRARPGDLVVQAALGATAGGLTFFELPDTGLSTAKRDIAMQHAAAGFEVRETLVPAMTLDDVLATVPEPELHWLKIDVEGGELEVLQGWKSSPIRPWVVVVESTLPLTNLDSHVAWESLLEAKGYRFAYFDGLNRFYVSTTHEQLRAAFTCGPNVFDNFSLAPSSAFCAHVNVGYRALEQLRDEERRAAEARQSELRRALDVERAEVERLGAEKLAQQEEVQRRIDAEHAEVERLGAEMLAQQQEMQRRIDAEHAEVERLGAENLALQAVFEATIEAERRRGAALETQLAGYETRIQALDDLSRKHAYREGQLTERLRLRDEAFAEVSSQERLAQTQLATLRDAHAAEVRRFEAHVAWVEGEWQSADTRVDEARREAHRWWVEAEELRSGLALIEKSHSWRITAPLRVARRVAAKVARVPARATKAMVRPVVLWTMRRSLAVPVLREHLRGMLDAHPSLKRRFRNLALGAGLIHEEVTAAPVAVTPRRSVALRHATEPALSPQATRVLADLRRAIHARQS